MSKYKIAIVGPSGSGKGTQKDLLVKATNLPSASMGELLRAEVKRGGERGEELKKSMEKGVHVDNNMTNDLIISWISKEGQNGYIIDGYPRNPEQLEYFEKHDRFTHVIVLEIPDDEVIERISNRRICACGEIYHLKYNPPKNHDICDKCGAGLEIRADSTPEATSERIRLYHKEMIPVIKEWDKQRVVHRIDGTQTIPQVHQSILKALGYDKE